LQVLHFLHPNQVIHGDVKSCKILLGMNEPVKLADFVPCAQTITEKNKRTTYAGIPHWMAPEMVKQEPHDPKVDTWSLDI
ncbi:PAK1 kinase, partial [Ramphastos sulfuratus]|nr:PAK1 kinase [Ramphastos sulfuratus]